MKLILYYSDDYKSKPKVLEYKNALKQVAEKFHPQGFTFIFNKEFSNPNQKSYFSTNIYPKLRNKIGYRGSVKYIYPILVKDGCIICSGKHEEKDILALLELYK